MKVNTFYVLPKRELIVFNNNNNNEYKSKIISTGSYPWLALALALAIMGIKTKPHNSVKKLKLRLRQYKSTHSSDKERWKGTSQENLPQKEPAAVSSSQAFTLALRTAEAALGVLTWSQAWARAESCD